MTSSTHTPIAAETWYLPTYLIDDKGRPTGEISLFVREYRLRQRKRCPVLQIATDVWTFSTEEEMVAAIESLSLQELPSEADGDPLYVPESLALSDALVERTSVGVSRPAS